MTALRRSRRFSAVWGGRLSPQPQDSKRFPMPIIGEYHRRFAGNAQYSSTFPRGGNAALFSVEILAIDGGTSLTVENAKMAATAEEPAHGCHGCRADAPCSSCDAGPSRGASPAMQALGWGLLQGDRLAASVDPIWRAAIAAQAVTDAPGRVDD